jgi:hypothetical protein
VCMRGTVFQCGVICEESMVFLVLLVLLVCVVCGVRVGWGESTDGGI